MSLVRSIDFRRVGSGKKRARFGASYKRSRAGCRRRSRTNQSYKRCWLRVSLELLRDVIEVRGLGLLNIRTIFGESSVEENYGSGL